MKGVCFKEPLFHATVAGTKKQTRRIIKSTKPVKDCEPVDLFNEGKSIGTVFSANGIDVRTAKPRYNKGEVIFLKEPYVDDCLQGEIKYKYSKEDIDYLISAGFEDEVKIPGFWKNKLFMPESVARHFIKITDVRAERLQDISDEDCIKEGIIDVEFYPDEGFPLSIGYAHYDDGKNVLYTTRKEAYKALINSIDGKGTWDTNPWVWVYDYALLDRKER